MSTSPIHSTKCDGLIISNNSNHAKNPIGINSVSSSNSNIKIYDQTNVPSPTGQQQIVENDDYKKSNGFINTSHVSKDATPTMLAQWMSSHRLGQYVSTFTHFTGADVLRMSKEDLIQICGLADGIRMHNTLHSKYKYLLSNEIDCIIIIDFVFFSFGFFFTNLFSEPLPHA